MDEKIKELNYYFNKAIGISYQDNCFIEVKDSEEDVILAANKDGMLYLIKVLINLCENNKSYSHYHLDEAGMANKCDKPLIVQLVTDRSHHPHNFHKAFGIRAARRHGFGARSVCSCEFSELGPLVNTGSVRGASALANSRSSEFVASQFRVTCNSRHEDSPTATRHQRHAIRKPKGRNRQAHKALLPKEENPTTPLALIFIFLNILIPRFARFLIKQKNKNRAGVLWVFSSLRGCALRKRKANRDLQTK